MAMAGTNDNASRIARSAALTLVISVAVLYLGDRFGIAARFAACAAADLMCMVSHVDQDECDHLHALFSWDGRKPRGRSRLDVIFGGDAL